MKNNKTLIKHKKIKKDSLSFIKNSTDFKKLILRKQNSWTILNQKSHIQSKNLRLKSLLIYNYSLTNNLVKEAGYRLGFRLLLTKEIKKATIIIGFKKHLRQNINLKKIAKRQNIPVFTLNRNSAYQLVKLLQSLIY